MLIGAQAFQTTPVKHAPAIVLVLRRTCRLGETADRRHARRDDHCRSVGRRSRRRQGRCGQSAAISASPQQGVLDHGLEVMGGRPTRPAAPRARRDRRVFGDRARLSQGLGLRAGRRRHDLFRLHARRSRRHRRRPRRHAGRGVGLCRDGGGPVRAGEECKCGLQRPKYPRRHRRSDRSRSPDAAQRQQRVHARLRPAMACGVVRC